MARLRQRQPPADAVALLVGSGDHVERERDIAARCAPSAPPPPGRRRPTAAPAASGSCGRALARCRRSACGRTRRNSAPACAASRRCRSRARAPRSRPPARRPSRPTSRPACARGRRDCWWCRRSGSSLCQSASATGTLVLPMITAPAAFSRWTATASSVGRQSLKAGMPQVVGRPATLNDSFTVIGRPSSGRRSPRASAWSAAIAAWRARSKSRTTTALMDLSSASMRAMAWSSSSTAETRRAARSADKLAGGAIRRGCGRLAESATSPRRRTPRQRQPGKPGGRPGRPRPDRRILHRSPSPPASPPRTAIL